MLSRLKLGGHRVVARVTLDVAVRREFDYLVPEELERSVHEGTRVKVWLPLHERRPKLLAAQAPEN